MAEKYLETKSVARPKRRKRARRPCIDHKVYERHNARVRMANPDGKLRGPNGKRLCRWCGTEVTGRRICWCSDACVHEYRIRAQASYARSCVYDRDRGVCAGCGVNASKLRGRLKRMTLECRKTYAEILGLGRVGYIRSLWQADHIVPVAEGGGSCGLENLRTLCLRCHRHATARLRRRLADARTKAKAQRSARDS